jgi:hypothetical protein
MNDTNDGTWYKKPKYVINVLAIYNTLLERLEQEVLSGNEIRYTCEMLKNDFTFYCEHITIKGGLSYHENMKQYELLTTHPSFYKWLGFALTIQDHKSIVMQLQAYSQGKYGEVDNFYNQVENMVINSMAFMPFDHMKQDHAVERWILHNNYPEVSPSNDFNEGMFQIDGDKPKQIFILPGVQIYLNTLFSNFLDNQDNRANLGWTMQGYFLIESKKISLTLKANTFCDVIKQLKEGKEIHITSNKTQIAEWICANFQFVNHGRSKEISLSYCIQLLAGRETPKHGVRIKVNLPAKA